MTLEEKKLGLTNEIIKLLPLDSDIKNYKHQVQSIAQKYFPLIDKDGLLQNDILSFAVKARNAYIFCQIMWSSIFDYDKQQKAWTASQPKNYPDKAEILRRIAR